MILANEATAQHNNYRIRARIIGYQSFAHEPKWFTTAPITAARTLMDKIGWNTSEVDLWEVNEAFAVVPMAFMREIGIGADRMNLHGGACAIGHPVGSSGSRIIVTLLNAMEKHDLKRGIASVCIGGGEGTAIAIERI